MLMSRPHGKRELLLARKEMLFKTNPHPSLVQVKNFKTMYLHIVEKFRFVPKKEKSQLLTTEF